MMRTNSRVDGLGGYTLRQLLDEVARRMSDDALVRCGGCVHRPRRVADEGDGHDWEFLDEVCPCRCEDGWYSYNPPDDWFCPRGESDAG